MSVDPRHVFTTVPYAVANPVNITGPLRAARVHHGIGVVVESGSERLQIAANTYFGVGDITMRCWMRPLNAAGGETRGILEAFNAAGSAYTALRYSSTQVVAITDAGSIAVNIAAAADVPLFVASCSSATTGLTVVVAREDGTVLSANNPTGNTAALITRVDIGNSVGQSKANAAIEEVLLYQRTSTVAELTAVALNGDSQSFQSAGLAGFGALTSDVTDLTLGLSVVAEGSGVVVGRKAVRSVYPGYLEELPPDAQYDEAGATFAITLPTGSGIASLDVVEIDGRSYQMLSKAVAAVQDKFTAVGI